MKKILVGLMSFLVVMVFASYGKAATVHLVWDAVPTATGYKMYYGTASRVYNPAIDVGDLTSGEIILDPGTYFFAVTAYNKYGESGYSEEVSNIVIKPLPSPVEVITHSDGRETIVSWKDYVGQFPSYGFKIELDGNIVASVEPNVLEYNLGELSNGEHSIIVYTYNEYGQTASNQETVSIENVPLTTNFTGKLITTYTFENGQIVNVEATVEPTE